MIIDHPLLGPRDAAEFVYLGDAAMINRPDGMTARIIAEAEKQSNILKGEGEAARNQILNEAFAKDPEFFEFIRSMEAYADTFKDGTTTMVISPDSDFFEYFENSEGAN